MCISIPAKIIAIEGKEAVVEQNSFVRRVLLSVEGASTGDWVLIYAGTAITLLDREAAEETAKLFRESVCEP